MGVTDLITLAEARSALRLPDSDTSHDADLSTIYIPAVTSPVEDIVGPVVSRSYTRTFDGGVNAIVLLGHDNVTVTSVVENGITLTDGSGSPDTNAGDFIVDNVAGIVIRGSQLAPRPYFYGRQNVTITWTAGMVDSTTDVPAPIKLAARIIMENLWQSDQQGFRPQFGAPDMSMVSTPSGFLIPNRAMQLLQSIDRAAGVS